MEREFLIRAKVIHSNLYNENLESIDMNSMVYMTLFLVEDWIRNENRNIIDFMQPGQQWQYV